jgi:hypothetical protein
MTVVYGRLDGRGIDCFSVINGPVRNDVVHSGSGSFGAAGKKHACQKNQEGSVHGLQVLNF